MADYNTSEPVAKEDLGDVLVGIAQQQLLTSNDYKKPLLEKWKKFDDLYEGNVPKRLRIEFNVPLPIFPGMLDTLAADFDEPIELEFSQRDPADYFKVQKIQAAFDMEKNSTDVAAQWDYKARVDKKYAIRYGRGILKYYAESDPKYKSILENVDPYYFHSQPTGGGKLENHLWCGQEGIFRTEYELQSGADSGFYDSKQIAKLKEKARAGDYDSSVTDQVQQKLSRFKALGLQPDNNNYIGEKTYNLCEWGLTYRGTRYYLLFDPWTNTWVRCEKLKTVFSKNLWPWVSWATHEDGRVFWSKSYADDLYPVSDSIVTLFNQELNNRQKRNTGSRAYDKDIFTDVAKLDAAQYRSDALVPADTKGGTRKISEGIYYFETPELTGTINLLNWMDQTLQRESGVTDIAQGQAMLASKKVNVAYIEQTAVAKRIGHKAQSYSEAWCEIGTRFIQGLKDHMSEKMYIEMLGDTGIEPDVLTREDISLKKDAGVMIVSSIAQKSDTEKKRLARVEALKMLMQDQNVNSEWRTSSVLRDVGGFSEDEIKIALDTKNYSAKESLAKAHIAIQEMLSGKEPGINYAADTTFIKTILDYAMDHRNKLGKEKFKKFAVYVSKHAGLAYMNGQRRGQQRGQQMAKMQPQQPQNQQKQVVQKTAIPTPNAGAETMQQQ